MLDEKNMKTYYAERFGWIFRYTSKNFFYCILKTFCIIIGLPIYSVAVVLEMLFTVVNMVFCWIPVLNVVITTLCKSIIWLVDKTFYICILTDIKRFKAAMKEEPDYEVVSDDITENSVDDNMQQ